MRLHFSKYWMVGLLAVAACEGSNEAAIAGRGQPPPAPATFPFGTPPPSGSHALTGLPPTGTAGQWTTTNLSFVASTMLLLTDGRLMAQHENAQDWWILTPDHTGSYTNGTWTQAASMQKGRLYYGSAVLKDGRVVVFGGEYTGAAGQTEDTTGDLYDPTTNTWSPLTGPPGWSMVGDVPVVLLPDGRLLMGSIQSTATALWDPATNTFSDAGTKLGQSDEETWVLLPNGSVFTVDCHSTRPQKSELWVPGQGWVEGGDIPVDVVEVSSEEIGPAMLLNDGRVMYFGATGHTALYTPSATLGQPGTWVVGPDLPHDAANAQVVTKDAPGVLMPNGHVLLSGSSEGTSGWGGPTNFYDVDPTTNPVTITAVQNAPNNAQAPYEGRFMLLPTGEVAYTQGSQQISFYGTAPADLSHAPAITTAPAQAAAGTTFQLRGTGFNGMSQAVMYGDDATSATNYPLVRLTNLSTQDVFYARTHDHSTMAVATGAAAVTTQVTLPASLPGGNYQLQVVANAVASPPAPLQVAGGTCGGCIDANNVCQPGTSNLACGAGGAACVVCASGTNCGAGACQAANDFSIAVNPGSLSVQPGGSLVTNVQTAVTSGVAQAVALSASGLPAGITVTFSPTSVTAGGTSTLALAANATALAGSYNITVTGTAASGAHAAVLALTVVGSDFSLSVSPAQVSMSQGGSASATLATAVTTGSAQTVAFSASGLPQGATATFSPASVTAGGSATVTVTASASTPPGSYSVSLTGTGTTRVHTVALGVQVTAVQSASLTNGGFETGTLAGWTAGGTTSVSSASHSGAFAAMVGGSTPTVGDSSLSQTFTIPAGVNTLSFFYKVVCPDTLTYDWATASLTDHTSGASATLVAKTCTNNGAWVPVTASVTPGDSVTLTLTSHDDDYASDPTYTLYDDVSLSSVTVAAGLTNGTFENGLNGWTTSGTATVSSQSHSGAAAAMLGATTPTNGDSSLSQTFVVPAGATTLSFWWGSKCPDTVSYDWARATLLDNTTGTTRVLLAPNCPPSFAWTPVTASIIAGHRVTLTLVSHDDNYGADPTYTLYDDVTVQ